jgi:hypothetical protein
MTRLNIAIAAAALALPTVLATAAQACISCEYTPEVARSSSTTYEGAGSYSRQRSYTVERSYEPRRAKHVAKEIERPAKKVRKTETASKAADKPAPVKAAAAKIEAKVEKVAVAAPKVEKTQKVEKTEQVATLEPVTVEQKPVLSENSSISVAATKVADATLDAPIEKPQIEAAAHVGCKKFFPAVGMTITVACE